MRQKLGKKIYDTETAELVKKVTSGVFGDAAGYEESLYVTPEGFYFLYVNGGEESIHPTEDIKRMSKDKANEWLNANA